MNELRCDWYQATMETETVAVIAMLQLLAGETFPEVAVTQDKPRNRYHRNTKIEGPYFTANVLDLGNDAWPFVIATGANADPVRRAMMQLGAPGRVSRIDIARDSLEGWDAASDRVQRWADAHPTTTILHMGDFHRGEKGRTLYLGAPQSARRIRAYEKGIQVGGDPAWVRVEFQYRPENRAAKQWAFAASIEELANSSRAFVSVRGNEGVYAPPVYDRPARHPLHALAHQYGRLLQEEVPEAYRIIIDRLRNWKP